MAQLIAVILGIPQSSRLSPMFYVYINELQKAFLYSNYLLFADDLKSYLYIYSINDCKKLQYDF